MELLLIIIGLVFLFTIYLALYVFTFVFISVFFLLLYGITKWYFMRDIARFFWKVSLIIPIKNILQINKKIQIDIKK